MIRFLAAAAIAFSAFVANAAAGPGDLLISPVRVVFDGRDRTAELTLVNRSTTPATYRIEFEDRRMTEDGGFEVVEAPLPGEKFSKDFVRYAPRRIALEPGKPQTVRLMLRKPSDLSAGEYRSHLHFSATPDSVDAGTSLDVGSSSDGIAIRLTPVYGVTIPVIVRHGDLDAAVDIADARIERAENNAALALTLDRSGNRSVYGDVAVYAGGAEPEVFYKGVAVYAPNPRRNLKFAIDLNIADALKGRAVTVEFVDRSAPGAEVAVRKQVTL